MRRRLLHWHLLLRLLYLLCWLLLNLLLLFDRPNQLQFRINNVLEVLQTDLIDHLKLLLLLWQYVLYHVLSLGNLSPQRQWLRCAVLYCRLHRVERLLICVWPWSEKGRWAEMCRLSTCYTSIVIEQLPSSRLKIVQIVIALLLARLNCTRLIILNADSAAKVLSLKLHIGFVWRIMMIFYVDKMVTRCWVQGHRTSQASQSILWLSPKHQRRQAILHAVAAHFKN